MATGAAGAASLSLTVRLIVGQPAPSAKEDSAGDPHAILPEEEAHALPPGAGAGALLHPAALAAVAGSAKRLLALAGASPGADVGVLGRAMAELERLAAGGRGTAAAMDHAELSTSTSSTSADMDIDSDQLGGGGAKRKRDARRGGDAPQRPTKRRILAWRVRQYRSSVAKAKATARRARSRRAMRRKTGGWKSVQQQLARATLSDGLHRWSAGGGGGSGPAEQ
ncbi:uncharacterized protein [Lolium perenne]|uniref:uncharacterized protein n=1 Tax=Lolium perenne TaxID=4522 RepID=UPI0021F573C5|nr:uncharacterized protein LOC127331228 [Lolium perenne]